MTPEQKITKVVDILREHNKNEGEGSKLREAEHLCMEIRQNLGNAQLVPGRRKGEYWGEYHKRMKLEREQNA